MRKIGIALYVRSVRGLLEECFVYVVGSLMSAYLREKQNLTNQNAR